MVAGVGILEKEKPFIRFIPCTFDLDFFVGFEEILLRLTELLFDVSFLLALRAQLAVELLSYYLPFADFFRTS